MYKAFMSTSVNLSKVSIFHTDRGNESKNKLIEDVLTGFGITRSLSKKDVRIKNVQKHVNNPRFRGKRCRKMKKIKIA